MSMTKSRYKLEQEKRALLPPVQARPYPICREITRQLTDLRGNNGLPDVIYLDRENMVAWIEEMKLRYGEESPIPAQFDGVEVLPSKEPGINVVGKLPEKWR